MKSLPVKALIGDTVYVWKRIKRRPGRKKCGFCGGEGKARNAEQKLVRCPSCGGAKWTTESPSEAVSFKPLRTRIVRVSVQQLTRRDWKANVPTDKVCVEVQYDVSGCHDSLHNYTIHDGNIAFTREELDATPKPGEDNY